jgi:long-chain acyl-CoA synthetase
MSHDDRGARDERGHLERGVLRGDEFVDLDELRRRSDATAAGLTSLGVGPTDTVGMLLRNDHPYFEASFAASAIGAAPVPINWHGSPEEVAYVVADSRCKVLVGHADLLRPVLASLPEGLRVLGVTTPPDIADRYGIDANGASLPDGIEEWATWRDGFEPIGPHEEVAPSSMIYTSGTTGHPKGVRRLNGTGDQDRWLEYMADVARHFGIAPQMRTVMAGPLYHSAPNAISLTALGIADPLVVLQQRFDPEELLSLVERHQITTLYLVPTMFIRLLRLPEEVRARYDLTSLRHISHTAAPCPIDVKRALMDWLGPIVWEYYGATEVGLVVGCDPDEWLGHPGTVGKAMATCTVKVFNEDGGEASVGEPGEVFVRAGGFTDFTYEGKDEARSEIEREGLVTCGDVGYFDSDGFLYLCDRVRDMIISGGVNIYPAEIEECLHRLEGVHDCAVFGIPDAEFGEAIAAAISLTPGASLTAAAVQDHVRAHLASFKVPRLVEFHDELPREDSGKMFKRKLRAPHWEAAGRQI